MPNQRESSDTPKMDTDDTFIPQEASPALNPQQDPNNFISRIRTAISQMSASGPDAELNYQSTLRALASDPQAAVAAVATLYRTIPEDQYMERWSQVHLLADLRNDAALSVFDTIISTPLPPERAPDMITYSTVGEEVMIRTTAIEGVTRLAASGDRQALELLRKHVQHDNFSVRRAAIQGYVEAAGQGARDELRNVLPAQDHFILDIRRAEVQDVPQPRVERTSDEQDQVPPARVAPRPKIEK
jgi:hypothetical protein